MLAAKVFCKLVYGPRAISSISLLILSRTKRVKTLSVSDILSSLRSNSLLFFIVPNWSALSMLFYGAYIFFHSRPCHLQGFSLHLLDEKIKMVTKAFFSVQVSFQVAVLLPRFNKINGSLQCIEYIYCTR